MSTCSRSRDSDAAGEPGENGVVGRTMMRVRLGNGLLSLLALVVALGVVIYFLPGGAARLVLGLPFVLLFPGYALTLALFPAGRSLTGLTRLALSIVTSITAGVLLGLVLNYTPWGLTVASTLAAGVVFIAAALVIAALRQQRLPVTDRFSIEFSLSWRRWSAGVKTFAVVLVLVVLGTVGATACLLANPDPGQKYTEFFIPAGPGEVVAGQEAVIELVIVNHEDAPVDYRVEVNLDGDVFGGMDVVALKNDERWEGSFAFVPPAPGPARALEFVLYKNGRVDSGVSPLRLYVDVAEKP